MTLVAEYAMEVANIDLQTPLVLKQEEVPFGNSFQGYGKLCKMMQMGIGAVLGPSSKHTALHLMSICDAKDVPYFYGHMLQSAEAFNLHPHQDDISKALHSLLIAFQWSRFIFLYESTEYLNILNTIMALYGPNGPIITVLRYDINLNGNFKSVLRRIRKSIDNYIVVVGSSETMPEFLRQAQQVGIINEDYKYIIGNLDFHSFDLDEYKYSEANITSLRMFSPEKLRVKELMLKLGYMYALDEFQNGSCPITVEMALTYDAVQLIAETTKHISLKAEPLNCTDRSDGVTEDGSTFKNYVRSLNIHKRTLTGQIYFEGNVRKGYTFDVIELQPSGIVKVGTWNELSNYTSQRLKPTSAIFENFDNTLVNRTFIILLSVPNKPYASLVESYKKLDGNNQYEGYGVELIKELANKLGFNYTLINGGNDYGSYNKTTNTSTGMLKEIREGRADLAVTDLTITSEREEAVDFSIPFMSLGIAILYVKPQQAPPATFSFMDPFSEEVWWYLGLAFLGVSLSFFILGRLSPKEWDNPCPCIEEPIELENQFTISNSLWFTTGALLQQGSEIAPKALSVRTVASIWWFFTLIMVSSYTANLAAFLTIETPTTLIENVNDLAENKGGVVYGAKRTGSTRNFFMTSEDERYKKMNEFMTKNPQYLTETNQEGFERVKNSKDHTYAFLMESTSIEYNTMRECSLKKIGDALDEKGYGIAMRKSNLIMTELIKEIILKKILLKDWPYRDKFNNALLELQEQGVLAKMKNKWWNEVGAGICTSKAEQSDAKSLSMENLEGIYVVLLVGSGLALLHGIISWICFVIRKASNHKVSLKDAFTEEFKFVIDFSTYTRELKTSASIYSRSRNSSISIDTLDANNTQNI
ncbi:glutamate receptor ionotropic, kainate 2-like isoform X1 [Glossina fuscipes]|uniref:Glutamate receptor ionotropic, kainate 2-like isoform X1 n=1 Tax=Glossina fuscipes TaxID=7396 RepID=A0A9C5Z9C8_9MUSC|nr:glutamate receptor ionotropic, kainate 2-like isoform X1 [Glossina fuscipes]